MKIQIVKVALMATLAFIGAGFAGTQQAKATDCKPDSCQDAFETTCTNCKAHDIIELGFKVGYCTVVNSDVVPSTFTAYICKDCDGDCLPNKRREKYTNKQCTKTCYQAGEGGRMDKDVKKFWCGQKMKIQYHPTDTCARRPKGYGK